MKSTDPASLQNLNDIVLPPPASWWPLATGWYFLFAFSLIVIAWVGFRLIRRWIDNRYRRSALRELQLLAMDVQNTGRRDASLRQLPALIKRTALSAYPRIQVASLSGHDWYDFLNSQLTQPVFTEPTTRLLDSIAYSTGRLSTDSESVDNLLESIKHWLKHHQAPTRVNDGRKI